MAPAVSPSISVQPPVRKKKKIGSCGFLVSLAAIGIATGTYVSPAVYHDVQAHVTQTEHVGHGIYLDWDNILESLTEEEQAVVRNVERNPRAVVELFTAKLGGLDGGEPEGWAWFPRSRNASEYLNPGSPDRGSCRHRASILVAILNHLQMEAHLKEGDMTEVGLHLWVELPSLGLAADAYAGTVMSVDEYERGYQSRSLREPTPIERFIAGTFY